MSATDYDMGLRPSTEAVRMRIGFIVPTKGRPASLRRMLGSLRSQVQRPDQVVIVDSSDEADEALVDEFSELPIDYCHYREKPSAAAQRNAGVQLLHDDIELVCFFDDDQILQRDAVAKMLQFWAVEGTASESASLQVDGRPLGAATFYNTDNEQDCRRRGFKRFRLSELLGLYCRRAGGVAPSGWQSLYGVLTSNTDVEWMGSGAAVVKRSVLAELPFDEFFTGYSYLEDLDFSYAISRRYRMVVVVGARFDHHHAAAGRGSAFMFGKAEVRNRWYFVRKHRLSSQAFAMAMTLRWMMSICSGQFGRAVGNVAALLGR